MAGNKKKVVQAKIIKTEVVKINGESKIKVDYDDGTVAYRSL